MSTETIGRAVGALFLLAFVLYAAGNALVDSGSSAPDVLADVAESRTRVSAGALLMVLNSAVVAGLGVLAFPVLKAYDEISALAYLIGRAIEAVLLTTGVLFLLLLVPLAREYADAGAGDASVLSALAEVLKAGNQYSYQIAMMAVASAGLVFCRVLLRARLAPRFLAGWGLAGYGIFLAGALLEVLGHGVGVALAVPGGLFEVALGLLLVVRGFPSDGNPVATVGPAHEQAGPTMVTR